MTTYKNIRRLGGGGFGDVFECETADKKIFAKKVLKSTDPDDISRFLKEVRILSALDHPNIVKVTAKYLTAAPYSFIMPKYNCSLQDCFPDIIADEKRIVLVFTAILNAVDYAHKQNIIHRDLKPSNVLLNSDSEVVVTDFGLGRVVAAESVRLTQSGQGFGTPGYASPEQWEEGNAKNADARSDIYTLGIILYELYVGLLNGTQADLSLLSPKIRLLVERCLRQKPEERFQSVEAFKSSWLAITGQTDEALATLNELAAELSTSAVLDENVLNSFIEVLAKNDTNRDAILESLLTASAKTIAQMLKKNHGFTIAILDRFLDHVRSQQWPSDYGHKIAVFCDDVIDLMEDLECKAKLIATLLYLATQSAIFKTQKIVRKRVLDNGDAAAKQALENHIRNLPAEVANHNYRQLAILEKLSLTMRSAFEDAILGESNHDAFTSETWQKFTEALRTIDESLSAKLNECTHSGPELKSRTIFLRMKDALPEKLIYQVGTLEAVWSETIGHACIIILVP